MSVFCFDGRFFILLFFELLTDLLAKHTQDSIVINIDSSTTIFFRVNATLEAAISVGLSVWP